VFINLIILVLALIFFQDIKNRTIHIFLPIALFLFSYFLVYKNNNLIAIIILSNLFFFTITISILVAYMYFKTGLFQNPFKHYFGFGDLLFYISISPLFLLKEYIVFFILSMFFSIMLQMVFKKNIKKESVPLAGFSSILLIIVLFLIQIDVLKIGLV
jgi:hypothetical protein